MRQVDVLVRQRIGQYERTIAIDCKDYGSPVDVKGIEEFNGWTANGTLQSTLAIEMQAVWSVC